MKAKFLIGFSILVGCLVVLNTVEEVEAAQSGPIPTTNLTIRLGDIEGFDLYYDAPCLGDCGPERDFEFEVDGSFLVDGETKIRVNRLSTLTSSLHTLYPGTRNVHYLGWTDYYPYAQVIIYLDDGKIITIESSSQFARMVPWNIKVWQENEDGEIDLVGSYVALHDGIHKGLSVIWQDIFGENFPNDSTYEEWFDRNDWAREWETLNFNYEELWSDESSPDDARVIGAPSGVLDAFIEPLSTNRTVKELFDSGFEIYDAVFSLKVSAENLVPLEYGGTLAFKAPNSPDVVVGTVVIALEPEVDVETSFALEEIEAALSKRQSRAFLNETHTLLPGIVYFSDLRIDPYNTESGHLRGIACDADNSYKDNDFIIEAVLTDYSFSRLVFYYFPGMDVWSVDFVMDRDWDNWDDDLIGVLLDEWWPPGFEEIDPTGLEKISTHFEMKFASGYFKDHPDMLDLIVNALPPEVAIHTEHPQKEGDKTVFELKGWLILPQGQSEPQIIYCGVQRPSWYGPPYDVEGVIVPSNPPDESLEDIATPGDWIKTRSLPFTTVSRYDISWTSIGSSSPGLIHFLWTTNDAVYFAEGNVDGTNWTKPQKLGEDSWNMQVDTNSAGDLHLLWSTHYAPVGTMHLWKPAGGEWQEPEYWEGLGFFNTVILGEDNRLHLAWSTSDGLDEEFFYADWTRQAGLSASENVSRRIGDVGSGSIRLNLDKFGKVHAVWAHPLIEVEYFDPLTGESFVEKGIFYSTRMQDGSWTIPELVGYLAPFSYSFDFEITSNNEIVVVWQTGDGIVASLRKNSSDWSEPIILHEVTPPEEPAPFGPGRWVVPTAMIEVDKNSDGVIFLSWLLKNEGVYLMSFGEDGFGERMTIYLGKEGERISHDFDMAASKDLAHFLFYINESLTYAAYNIKNGNDYIATKSFGIHYDYYGSPVATLIVDDAGFVYVLGLPKEPLWTAFTPETGISKNKIEMLESQPTPSPPVQTDSPESTQNEVEESTANSEISSIHLFWVILILTLTGYVLTQKPSKIQDQD